MIAELMQSLIEKFIGFLDTFFEYVFGGVDFDVLWRWLPADIGSSASVLIVLLFGLALISLVRKFLPF